MNKETKPDQLNEEYRETLLKLGDYLDKKLESLGVEQMRDPKRIDRILKLIEKKWQENPDQRLGQLLENYAFKDDVIFQLEDDVVEKRLK
ncbi:MAG: hypothetical protein ABH864_05260 [archaeon]